MPVTENASIEYEFAQALVDWEAMTNTAGDRINYESSASPWSGRSGFEAEVRPYGLATGGKITPAISGSNNLVDVAALTVYMPGIAAADANGLVTVAPATDETITRAATLSHQISSVTVDNTGAIAIVAGTEGSSFSETRGAAGGPPFIPVDSVEIGQVRFSAQAAAAVVASEIKQTPGTHQERFDNPLWSEDPTTGEIEFSKALPQIHTGSVAKKVYVKYYTPDFVELADVSDWVPALVSNSGTSTKIYKKTVVDVSSTQNSATFTARLKDGLTDPIIGLAQETLWFRYKQDENRTPYSLTQGVLSYTVANAAGARVLANFTITPTQETRNFEA